MPRDFHIVPPRQWVRVHAHFHQINSLPEGAPANAGVGSDFGGSQGGTPVQIATQADSGLSHAGGESAGFDAKGKPVAARSDSAQALASAF